MSIYDLDAYELILKEDLSEEKMEIKEEDIVVSRTFDNEEGENK